MQMLNWLTTRLKWLAPIGVIACAALLLIDLFLFWAMGRRPLMSTFAIQTVVWSLLGGTAAAYAIQWAILGGRNQRVALAATLMVTLGVSALHPWHNKLAVDVDEPMAPTLASPEPGAPTNVVVYAGGPLSEADDKATW